MSDDAAPNFFANDGSFLDQFRKKIANQNKLSESDTPIQQLNCPKKAAPFRPKTACKRINMKASLKKQLKTDLADKGTSDKPRAKDAAGNEVIRVSKRWDKRPDDLEERRREEERVAIPAPPAAAFPPQDKSASSSPENADPTRKRKRKSRWGERGTTAAPTEPLVRVVNGVPIVIPTTAEISPDVTARALASLVAKKNGVEKNKYEYDSDEETTEEGTWEHKQRLAEMALTEKQNQQLNTQSQGKHHLGDFLPKEELERFYQKVSAVKKGTKAPTTPPETALGADNVGYKMLQKAGWKEGSGLGATGSGIVAPIDRGNIKPGLAGLGAAKPDDVSAEDDEFDIYRKRMMLAYRYRPNPMKNPRRAYY